MEMLLACGKGITIVSIGVSVGESGLGELTRSGDKNLIRSEVTAKTLDFILFTWTNEVLRFQAEE